MSEYDVVIIGGGAAGLSAALVLSRARRTVLVVDSGSPRNAPAAHMQGFLSRDGLAPAALLAAGRDEVTGYGGQVLSGTVTGVAAGPGPRFEVRLAAGGRVSARRLLVAAGLRDEIPDIPGLRERWARDVLHCPYCHGWEVRDQRLGVLADGSPGSVRYAQIVRQWTDDLIVFVPSGSLTAGQREGLTARAIGIVEAGVNRILVKDDHLAGVELDDGRLVHRDALFVPPRFVPHDGVLTALGAMFGMAVADGYLDYNPFHDVKIPKVPGRRAIKIATPEQYAKVRGCLPTKPARVFSTLLVSSGMRFCEAIGLQPADFDFEAGILEVARSVVKVSRQHHPQGKTFLVRDYTKNGQTRRLKLDRAVVELVRGHVAEHGIGATEVIFPAELVVPPRRIKPRLTEEQLRALGDCEPVGGRVYAHGTLGGYVRAKCRCEGCRQWAREYGRERMRVRRAAASASGQARRRWEKSRDADESYLDEQIWDRIWARAVADSGIPFKPTAYQVRHTHASWLIDAGENPKAVMHRLGQADLRTTARYVHVLDETGESAARRFEGLLPPL